MESNEKNLEEITFEVALNRLERVVASMEDGSVPLADLVKQYEEGTQYLRICQKLLEDAELKIDKLKSDHQKLGLEPMNLGDGKTSSF